MHLLPKARRQAMYTLYAFCRHLDDIADEPGDRNEKLDLLRTWRKEIDNIYDTKVPATVIGRRIYKNCMRFKLPKEQFILLIDTIASDIITPMQAPGMDRLLKYCEGAAGAPGNLSLRIFGFDNEYIIETLSKSLGTALQITNILRDVREDADMNRLYLPRELLQKAGIQSTDPKTVVIDKNLSIVREELSKLAAYEYEKSFKIIEGLNNKSARPVRIIASLYKRYFDIMQNRGWEIVSPKPRISKIDKFFIIFKAFFNRPIKKK